MKTSLYINGCSFTRGDSLVEEKTWPALLQSATLPVEYTNDSANGNSFGSTFYTTLAKLSKLDNYEDLFVVIGITWSPRYAVFFDKSIASITPADVFDGETKTEFSDKYSTHRRLVSPYFDTWPIKNKHIESIEQYENIKNNNGYNDTLTSFAEFYKNITKHDPNIKNNQNIALLSKLIALQSFFETNNITYRFIDFSGMTNEHSSDEVTKSLINKINKKLILPYTFKYLKERDYIDPATSHPNADGCKFIANKLETIYNEL